MQYIKIFNVKHGDLGVYCNTQKLYTCVLDCGTSQKNSSLHTDCLTTKRIVDFVVSEIALLKGDKDVLISHYHEDHFNAIGAFKRYRLPFFSHMYIPFINFRGDYARQIVAAMCLLEVTSQIIEVPFTLLRNFSDLFMGNYANNYTRLGTGDRLGKLEDGRGVTALILWPPRYIFGTSKKLDELINKLKHTLRKHDLEGAIEKTRHYFSELDEKLVSTQFTSESLERQERKEVDANKLVEEEPSEEQLNHSAGIRGAFKQLRNAVREHLNTLSIVFRIGNKVVWMGDVTESVLEILKKDLKGNVEYLKLPHHGTIDVSGVNIKASKFIISNSDGKHYGGRSYKPINRNNLGKALKDNTFIMCTDGHGLCDNHLFHWAYYFQKRVPCSRHTQIELVL